MKFVPALLVSLTFAAVLLAQSPEAARQQPTFKAGINFVRVDVYPTANGRIVADLKQDEFEVLEDGVPQRIDTFERVAVRAPGPESERAEPRSVAQSNAAAADPRNRLFVLFLDSYHASIDYSTVSVAGGMGDTKAGATTDAAEGRTGLKWSRADSRIGGALVRFFDRLIGPDDLVGLLRPEEPATSLIFTRRPASFYDLLMSGGWERRFVRDDLDERERMYRACYGADSDFAAKMIARRRERMVLDALHGLVVHLRTLREERKAIIVITEGWQLYRPDPTLRAESQGRAPGPPPIGIAGGRPALGDSSVGNIRPDCDRDRMILADLDDERDFRAMLDEANRANASFYPVDPRGLPVFDTPMGPDKPLPTSVDSQALRGRLDSLRTLAEGTDGVAILNSNDFATNLARISDDLSSYYLLGYYSTNPKHDGKFRKISVRVKRPGVLVRARRGYLALTEAEAKATEAAASPPDAAAVTLNAALDTLDGGRPNQVLVLRGSYAWPAISGPGAMSVGADVKTSAGVAQGTSAGSAGVQGTTPVSPGVAPGTSPTSSGVAQSFSPVKGAILSVIVELDPVAARGPGWEGGGTLAASIVDLDGHTLATARATISPTARTCLIRFADTPLPAGDYLARVKAQWSVLTTTEQVRIKVPDPEQSAASVLGLPLTFRRGPFTGPGYQPTADQRFRKAERIRVDVPLGALVDSFAGRLLDRKGQPLAVPVTTRLRIDGGRTFVAAEAVLAPLALGDYVIEVSARRGERTDKVLAAIRIVP